MYANATLCCSDPFNDAVILPFTVLGIVLLVSLAGLIFACVAFFRNWDKNFGRARNANPRGDPRGGEPQAHELVALPQPNNAKDTSETPSKSELPTSTIRVVSSHSVNAERQQDDGDGFSTIIYQYIDNKDVTLGKGRTRQVEEQEEVEHRAALAQLSRIQPEPPAAFRLQEKYHMTMGLKCLHPDEWVLVDKNYLAFHKVRKQILDSSLLNSETLRFFDIERATKACFELLDLLIDVLTTKYPQFYIISQHLGHRTVYNKLTKELFHLEQLSIGVHPLEIAARLATEDFNILVNNGSQHILAASATLFPAGWRLQDRFGWPVTQLHGPVPNWENKLSKPVEHFFDRLQAASPMRRDSFFIQVLPSASSGPISIPTLVIQDPDAFFPPPSKLSNSLSTSPSNTNLSPNTIPPERILLRRERQTFRRLPKSGAIVFGVRTSVARLSELDKEECEGLAGEVRNWPDQVWKYKGGDIWGSSVLEYCEAVARGAKRGCD